MQIFSLVAIFALVAASSAAYAGPCKADACGASGEVCGSGILCVPYPTFDPAEREGCTCSGKSNSLFTYVLIRFANK